jgi:hypothetical protein
METMVKELATEQTRQFPDALKKMAAAIAERDADLKKRDTLQNGMESLEHQRALEERHLAGVQKSIETVEASKENQHAHELRQQLITVQDGIRSTKTGIIQVLRGLEDALPRYQRITIASKLVQQLRDAPLDVVEHHGNRLVDMAGDIRHLLEKGTIELKDKKRERALGACAMITKEWVDGNVKALEVGRKEEESLIKKIDATGIVEKLATLRKEEKDVYDALKRIRTDAEGDQAKLSKIDLRAHDEEFITAAKQLGINIKLA